jgi:nitrite reductase (NADH) large subunit
VIADSLGLGEELEAQMQNVVDTYQCEWKTAIENQQSRKRFRQFVNSEESDMNIVFVEEREQIRPATDPEKAFLIQSQSIQSQSIQSKSSGSKDTELATELV